MVQKYVICSILRTSLCTKVEVCFPVFKYWKRSRKESILEAALLLCLPMDQCLMRTQSRLEQKGWQWRPFVRLVSKYSPALHPFLQYTNTWLKSGKTQAQPVHVSQGQRQEWGVSHQKMQCLESRWDQKLCPKGEPTSRSRPIIQAKE